MNHSEYQDKFEIFELAYKFADAANRKDGKMFQTLWADESAQWIIGAPINKEFEGKENMGKYITQMLGLWEFFVQMVTGGVVVLNGNEAYARFYIQEIANSKQGTGNNNLSMYEDELIKKDDLWYFKKRTYHTIFQSMERQKGEVIQVPDLPKWCRDKSLNTRK
ncbi:MAG: nuclear transport factor 2 family protein [Thermonemataceae bacterium]